MASPAPEPFEIEESGSVQKSPSSSSPPPKRCGCGLTCCIIIGVVLAILGSLVGYIVVKYVIGWQSIEVKTERMQVSNIQWNGVTNSVTADVDAWLKIINPNDIKGELEKATVDVYYVPRLLPDTSPLFLATGSLPKGLELKAKGDTVAEVHIKINIDETTAVAWTAFVGDCTVSPSKMQIQLTLKDIVASLEGSPNIKIEEFETGTIETDCPLKQAGGGETDPGSNPLNPGSNPDDTPNGTPDNGTPDGTPSIPGNVPGLGGGGNGQAVAQVSAGGTSTMLV